jgi:hypothetical protein
VPREGLRFVVLDSITDECGVPVCSEGSLDDTQFHWLENEIQSAADARQYVIVFSHHTLRTMRMVSTDTSEYPLHFGERVDPEGGQPVGPIGDTLEDLYCRHPNVIAHVDGHEHVNAVRAHRCEDSPAKNPFVEVATAAHIDFPQQSREIELVDNGDGTTSLVLTILDHDGPPNPGAGNAGGTPLRLASIGREIGYNDYQGSRGAGGDREDRNVIVRLDKPWPPQP